MIEISTLSLSDYSYHPYNKLRTTFFLNQGDNELSGPIPSELGGMESLELFHLGKMNYFVSDNFIHRVYFAKFQ